MLKPTFICIVSVLLFAPFCSKMKGVFGVRYKHQDTYRHVRGKLEIAADERVDWVYKFADPDTERIPFGIIVMKKEIVWVEIFAEATFIGPMKDALHGRIEHYKPGEYKIVITNLRKESVVEEIPFMVYSDRAEY